MPVHDTEYAWINRIICRVMLRARIVKGQLHPDDIATLNLLGNVAGRF